MKNLNNYIIEKLHINKNVKTVKVNIKPANSELNARFDDALHHNNRTGKYEWDYAKHLNKMKGYMNKGSKPKVLVATIKDNRKLMNRWIAATQLEWDAAIEAFGQAIEDRGLFTLEEQHAYALGAYQYDNAPYLEHYLDLYNIAH